jgi:hypothetical protein
VVYTRLLKRALESQSNFDQVSAVQWYKKFFLFPTVVFGKYIDIFNGMGKKKRQITIIRLVDEDDWS